MNKLLVKNPLITEKATALSAFDQYVFLVAKEATGPEVKKVIEAVYKVKVTAVRMINTSPKPRRMGRNLSMKPGFKKAIVTLKKGEKIDLTVG